MSLWEINDLDLSKIVESSLDRKHQIESELKTLLDQYSSMVSPSVQHIGTKLNVLGKVLFVISCLLYISILD